MPALQPWCRDLDRVYQEEALPLRGPLVEDAVRLIDSLQAIVSTGTGVASMRVDAEKDPEHAALAVIGLHGGSLCSGTPRTALRIVGP